MFTSEERERIRQCIIDLAKNDSRLSGGAITGSVTIGKQDQWSDIDLAFGVINSSDISNCLSDFTSAMYDQFGALHHLDVFSGSWIYRVFFLSNTLQVDIAFAPEADFRAKAPTFKLAFGKAVEPEKSTPIHNEVIVGWAWLYALHARSTIERGQPWRAEYMISGMRDKVFELCCRRHNLPISMGRGIDELSSDIKKSFEDGLIRSLDVEELKRAFGCVVNLLVQEVSYVDQSLTDRLEPALIELAKETGR